MAAVIKGDCHVISVMYVVLKTFIFFETNF